MRNMVSADGQATEGVSSLLIMVPHLKNRLIALLTSQISSSANGDRMGDRASKQEGATGF